MNRRARPLIVGVLLLAGAAAGCQRTPEGWTPVLEETSTSYLETGIDRALERVSAARDRIRSDPDQAEELLTVAEARLRSLQQIFLPVFRARSRAYNAYRYHFLGRDDDAAEELEQIEQTLLEVGSRAEGPLLAELEQLQDRVSEARLELQADSPGTTSALRELARDLETFVARADFFV